MDSKSGLEMALGARGAQDKWMSGRPELFDCRKLFLTQQYQMAYDRIPVTVTWAKDRVLLVFEQTCDLVNMIDLVIDDSLYENIANIYVEGGGQRFDKFYNKTQIETTAAIFGRKVSRCDGLTIVPLAMAPFYETNLVMPSTEHHKLELVIYFSRPVDELAKEVQLYGNRYFLSPGDRDRLVNKGHEFVTYQSQYTGEEKIKKGINKIRLHFTHPCILIYFWGMDRSKVKNVKLLLDGASFYDGPLQLLENAKRQWLGDDVVPSFLRFTNEPFDKEIKSTVNFTRLDRLELVIETEEEEATVHVVGLNVQGFRYISGMVGLLYSK